MVLFPTANCRSILTSNTLCSTNLRTPSPQSPPRSSVQKEGKIETKQLGEAWPKKTGRQIMVKGGHHEERHAFSKQHFTTWAQTIQTFPWSFPTQNPPCATTFEEKKLRLPRASGLCLSPEYVHRWGSTAATVICHFVSDASSLASFLALQVPLKYLLYLLCARLSKKSVNMCSYPGIFPKPAQLNKSRKYHQEILF